MRNALKAVGVALVVIALLAPLIFWPVEQGRTTPTELAEATVTVPPIALVATTVPPGATTTTTTTTTQPSAEPPTTTTTTEAPIDITIAAVGDVIPHLQIVESVRNEANGSYDFYPVLAPVASYLALADYTVANLESPLAGPDKPYSDTPPFNAPDSIASALRYAGVDLVSTANNHALDQGWDGLVRTLDQLDAAGLSHVGTNRTSAERMTPLIVDVKGIKVGFLDYTDWLNGLELTDEHAGYAVNELDADVVARDAALARMYGADVVIALLHFGEEYERVPSERQTAFAKEVLLHGVDAIIGSHPHVVQPIEHVFEYKSRKMNDKYVFYSLGNFLSAQRERYRDSGLIAYIHITKQGLRASITGVSYLPVYVQLSSDQSPVRYRVLPVVPGSQPDTDTTLTATDEQRMASVWEELRTQLYRPDENIRILDPAELGL